MYFTTFIVNKILFYAIFSFRFDTQYILMENILLFISNKYIEFVNCIDDFMKSGNIVCFHNFIIYKIMSFNLFM